MVKKLNKEILFTIYRYQLLPISNEPQLEIFGDINSLEDIIKKKNELFHDSIISMKLGKYRNTELTKKIIYDKNNLIILKLASKKEVTFENRQLEKETHEHWPSVIIIVDNDPSIQKIAVSPNIEAFSGTDVIKKILDNNINSILKKFNLKMIRKDIFESKEFWDIINENKGKILSVEFQLVSPNMANISNTLKLDLKFLKERASVQETMLKLNSDPASTLTIDQNNELIKSIVDYSSQGGGDISIKIRKLRKKIKTSKTEKYLAIDELDLINISEEQAKKITGLLADD